MTCYVSIDVVDSNFISKLSHLLELPCLCSSWFSVLHIYYARGGGWWGPFMHSAVKLFPFKPEYSILYRLGVCINHFK